MGSVSFGSLTGQATATINNQTSASASLGGATASATYEISGENIAAALLGQLSATATATVTPSKKPAGGGGRVFIQPNFPQRPKPVEPQQIAEIKPVEEKKPVVKPKPIKTVKASSSVTLGGASAQAVGILAWVAELDDLEVLELL